MSDKHDDTLCLDTAVKMDCVLLNSHSGVWFPSRSPAVSPSLTLSPPFSLPLPL